jgi:hypothetical protein
MRLEFSQQIFEKTSSIKFHENPQSGSQVFPRGQTGGQKYEETDGQTYLTKLIVAFRNFANARKMHQRIMTDILLQKTQNPIVYTHFLPMRYLMSNISTHMVPTVLLWHDWSGQWHNQWLSVVSDHSQLTITPTLATASHNVTVPYLFISKFKLSCYFI